MDVTDQFQEIRDVIKRHETLVSTQKNLIVHEALQRDRIDQERLDFNRFIKVIIQFSIKGTDFNLIFRVQPPPFCRGH